MRRTVCLLVVAALLGACARESAETMTIESLDPLVASTTSPTTTTTVAETTTAVEASSTTAVENRRVSRLDPSTTGGVWECGDVSQSLFSQSRYEMQMDPVVVEFQPPSDHWDLCSYQVAGEFSGALMEWGGPSGFKAETLNLRVFGAGADLDAAWAWIDELGTEGAAKHGVGWTQVDSGTTVVGEAEAEWREFRTPELPRIVSPGFESFYIPDEYVTDVWGDTSVRFFVVPIEEFTVTIMVYETRCACTGSPHGLDDGDQIADEAENELREWLPELNAFLSGMSFEAP